MKTFDLFSCRKKNSILIRIPSIPGKTAQHTPESGKTWATFVPLGNVETPKALALKRGQEPPKLPEKL
jgi:hypothetical protein